MKGARVKAGVRAEVRDMLEDDSPRAVSDLCDWIAARLNTHRPGVRKIVQEMLLEGLLEDDGRRPFRHKGPAPQWVRWKGGHA